MRDVGRNDALAASRFRDELELALSWAVGCIRVGEIRKTAPPEAARSIIAGSQEAKMEILVRKISPAPPKWGRTALPPQGNYSIFDKVRESCLKN